MNGLWQAAVLIADNIDTILTGLAALAGLVFSPKLWRGARSTWNTATGFFAGMAHLNEVVETVRRIDEQVGNNGGKSLHDIVRLLRSEIATAQINIIQLTGAMRISFDALGKIGMFYADTQGGFTYLSAVLVRWLVRGEDTMHGRGWLSAVWIDDRERVAAEWDSCVRDRRDFLMRFAMSPPGGALFEVIASASPVRSHEGEVVLWVGTVRKALPNEAGYQLSQDEE